MVLQPQIQYKFLTDAMVGRLAKWLRLLGYDTKYLNETSSFELIRTSLAENRIILTRNKNLTKKGGCKIILVKSEKLKEQVKQVFTELKLTMDNLLSRCVICNELLKNIKKENIKQLVPEYVYNNHNVFKKCIKCGRVFWKGTHIKHINDFLQVCF